MLRTLILGGSGILGHKLWQVFQDRFDTWVTVRGDASLYMRYGLFDPGRVVGDVDVFHCESVERAVRSVNPDVVVNAIGVIEPVRAAADPLATLTVNSLFPHRLAMLCRSAGVRLVHISSDSVFSGRKRMYTEHDTPDPDELYGWSKLLGEVSDPPCLTLRTSILGRSLKASTGFVEWFLGNRGGRVQGYTRAIYSGFPTLILAQIIADILAWNPHLSGLYHVSSEPISKHELLCMLRDAYQVSIEIEPCGSVQIDRSLDSRRFREATGFFPQPWPVMVQAMVNDPTPYDELRATHVS